jgi:hypothetical protein
VIGIPTTDGLKESGRPGQNGPRTQSEPSLKNFGHSFMEIKEDGNASQFQWKGRKHLEIGKRVYVDKIEWGFLVKAQQLQTAQEQEHRILKRVSNLAASSR